MPKILKVAGGIVLLSVIGAASYFYYALSFVGETLKEVNFSEGKVGEFSFGVEKSVLISKNGFQFHAISKKPFECATGWVSSPIENKANKQCFLSANEWGAGSSGTNAICPPATDVHTTLFFSGERLAKINVRCTRPE